MRNGLWQQTYCGIAYYPADPHPDDVNIIDIAHALSHICRYAGHVKKFYSVAEHSYLVSLMVTKKDALQGLLHDATEAYCQDIPSPLKHYLPDYRRIEQLNRVAICTRFGLDIKEPETVKQADKNVLLSEHEALFISPMHQLPLWGPPGMIFDPRVKIRAFPPKVMEEIFLTRFGELIHG